MSEDELKRQIMAWKLTWLNGYLQALACLISENGLFFNCKLFQFDLVAGDHQRSLQHHAYELFGNYPNDWAIELVAVDDWQQRLSEFVLGLRLNQSPHREHVPERLNVVLQFFCAQLKQQCLSSDTEVFEMRVQNDGFYRIIGLDLVFELADEQLLVLQILGAD